MSLLLLRGLSDLYLVKRSQHAARQTWLEFHAHKGLAIPITCSGVETSVTPFSIVYRITSRWNFSNVRDHRETGLHAFLACVDGGAPLQNITAIQVHIQYCSIPRN